MTQQPADRYRVSGGVRLLEVRVHSALQLFDARDPAPFRARDLDDDFTEYVIASAEEFGTEPMKILIHVEEAEPQQLGRDSIRDAIKFYFQYQIDLRRLQLSKLFRTARLFGGIGLICLVVCLLIAKFLDTHIAETDFRSVAREGLIIFGWVSMWKPFELILFDWYPLYDRIRLMRKLLEADIEVRFESHS